ncbi:hypothetical protein COS16_10740, partial [Candidatus Desantisbacteria bacterium CG02_land_8_20_14_3_00_49_13]
MFTSYGAADVRFKIGVSPADADYITTNQDAEALYSERIKDASGTITGAGEYDIRMAATTTANSLVQSIGSAVSYLTYLVDAGAAKKVKITSPARTPDANYPSDSISVEVWNKYDARVTTFSGTVTLAVSSGTGKFSASQTPWSDTTVVYLSSGLGAVYYKDTTLGTYTITASRAGLNSDTQFIYVILRAPSETASSFTTDTCSLLADGISTATVSVFIKDGSGKAIPGRQVTVQSIRGAQDTITMVYATTDINGQATATVSSNAGGLDTLTALCDGCTVLQNIILNPSFEEGLGALPDNWSGPGGYAAWDLAVKHSGDKSAKTQNSQQVNWANWEQIIAVTPGSSYEFSGWIKTGTVASGAGAAYFIHHLDAGSGNISQNWTSFQGTDQDWTFYALYPVAESNCVSFRIGCSVYQPAALGSTAWFDDIRLKRVPTITFLLNKKLAIVTPPRSTASDAVSNSICVQVQDMDGNKDNTYNGQSVFSSSIMSGKFSATGTGGWSASNNITLNIVNGETYVYYKDTKTGSPVITVSAGVLPDTDQTESITPGAFSETISFIVLSPFSIIADGISRCTVTVFAADKYRNPVSGLTMLITTSRKGPVKYDTITQPVSQTDASGQATGSFVTSLGGDDTINAFVQGNTASQITLSFYTGAPAGLWDFNEGADSFAYSLYDVGVINTGSWTAGKYGYGLNLGGPSDSAHVKVQPSSYLENATDSSYSF